MTTRAAIGCFVVSLVLAIVLHPRIFYGSAGGCSFLSFDNVFFAGQWLALAMAALALGLSLSVWSSTEYSRTPGALWLPVCCTAVVLMLLATGVPHKANAGDWRNRKLGAVEFVKAIARVRQENLSPTVISADAFSGEWKDVEGNVYSFGEKSIAWRTAEHEAGYSAANCGGEFALRYIERDREVLQNNGMSWSEHAGVLYDSTAAAARIPVAEVACGAFDRVVFIRASPNEVWRWTNSLDLDAIKKNAFVLQRVGAGR